MNEDEDEDVWENFVYSVGETRWIQPVINWFTRILDKLWPT